LSTGIVIQRHFASDNYAGICPEAFAAMTQATKAMRSVMEMIPGHNEHPI
jgi:hypothetical protein